MKARLRRLPLALVLAALTGCSPAPRDRGLSWQAVQVWSINALQTPESVLIDPETGHGFVTNILPRGVAEGNGIYWEHDGHAYITRLAPGGHLHQHRWASSTIHAPLGSPKGMALIDSVLYVADCTQVARYVVATGQPLGPVPIPGAEKLNDVASDGQYLYVSDTATGKIHRLRGSTRAEVKAPPGINGLTFADGRMFGVSVTLHDVYELDPTGEREPMPFGLSAHFRALDGIEVLPDGSFLVSDLQLHALFWISSDRRDVQPLLSVETPADFFLDRKRSLLFVPSFMGDRVVVYALRQRPAKATFEIRTIGAPGEASSPPDTD
jgi:hypothetical protein